MVSNGRLWRELPQALSGGLVIWLVSRLPADRLWRELTLGGGAELVVLLVSWLPVGYVAARLMNAFVIERSHLFIRHQSRVGEPQQTEWVRESEAQSYENQHQGQFVSARYRWNVYFQWGRTIEGRESRALFGMATVLGWLTGLLFIAKFTWRIVPLWLFVCVPRVTGGYVEKLGDLLAP
jgi:hypothetical protein